MEDIHIMEALGRAQVVVKNGKVIEVGEPLIKYCPLFVKYRKISELNKETIKKNIEFRIKDFGLFTENRIVESKECVVEFGTSEIFMTALKNKLLDVVVIVSDCAGTVITNNPYLVQGLCGRISGIIKTTPIPKVIEKIENANGVVLNKDNAEINQIEGVKKALELGYKKIGVSVSNLEDAKKIKELEKTYTNNSKSIKIVTFGVHTTGYNKLDVEKYLKYLDLITCCASKGVLEAVKGHVKVQVGKSIPIFALTQEGRELILERMKELERPIFIIPCDKLPNINGDFYI
ncbi:methanogenesis marker 8 protein [Methanothermococcus okinawensis]|uniref:Methanogenesis marker protein 8 n=1 Tax=Methanothermococcus okinawensis (strain DSM 14208 / JCM 11175 / IH1) TaxID=647113 RepID=F8AMX5_METOI|nr:methanogenesis marker 8 protein [Methanothermococcus okinawensis]AEH06098.1 methanogenesis marker protein 8 [Methanothermococcus okinawensis IH1]